jgi:hypothetical protein
MSGVFSPGYTDLLRRKDKMLETHTTLEVLVENEILGQAVIVKKIKDATRNREL